MSDIRSYLPLWEQWNTEDLIGEGPDSKVYRAVRNTAGGQEFSAIKQIFVAPTEDPELCERRTRSLLALTDRQIALRGKPHFLEIYERQAFHRADGGYDIFIRMELSTSLRSVMGKTEFSEAMLSQLGQDLSTALLTLEQAGTCHGAIHPGNIFLSRDGTYKFGDYCRSRIRTTAGSAREYLAPEVLTGNSLPSVGADRYALGMVIYRLSNGLRGPFLPPAPATVSREEISQADRRRIRGEKLPDPVNASTRLAAILQRACAFAPENRYPTTEALQHDFMLLQDPDAPIELPKAAGAAAAAGAVKTKKDKKAKNGKPEEKPEKTPDKKPEKKNSGAFRLGVILAALILLAGAATAAWRILPKLKKDKQLAAPESTASVSGTERSIPQATAELVGTTAVTEAVTETLETTTEAPETTTEAPETTTEPTTEPAPPPTTEPAPPPTTQPPATEPTEGTFKPNFSLSSTYNYVDFDVPASGYIIPDSDSRYITTADLAGMTPNQVRIACNEIFARNGRKFTSQTMADYFGAMPWYKGTVDGSWFDSHMNDYMSAVEQANARTIVQYENSMGWTW